MRITDITWKSLHFFFGGGGWGGGGLLSAF